MLCVILNTLVMCLDNISTNEDFLNILDLANNVFTYTFVFEMSIKIIGLGPLGYVRDKMNLFDGFLVSISVLEKVLFAGGGGISAFRSIRIFRTFRVLRVTRLVRSLEFMKIIIGAIS